MELYAGLPYWIVKNPFYDYFNPLKKDHAVDVAIIGAGLTGALIAYELGRLGIDCCVVDKRSIGTGHSATGMALLQYETDTPLCRLIDQVGEKTAVAAYKASLQAITDLEKVFTRTHVHPEFERLPSVCYATSEEDRALLETEYKIRKKHRLPAELFNARELFRNCRFEAEAALVNKEAAQIDTYKATVGLLKYVMNEMQIPVFTHTEIKRWQATPRGCELMTDKGYVIECNYMVVATSFEAGPFLPRPVTRQTTAYALVSHPVDTRWLWPERSLIWETADPHLSIRTAGRNRIIVASYEDSPDEAQPSTPLSKEKIRMLEKKFMKLFPHFIFTSEMAWSGPSGTTPDGLPYIGSWPGCERMYFALGYGRNSIPYAMIAAQLIGKSLRRQADERMNVFGFHRRIH